MSVRSKEQALCDRYLESNNNQLWRNKIAEVTDALQRKAIAPEDEVGWIICPLTATEIVAAVSHLQKRIPQGVLFRVFVARKRKGTSWRTDQHFGFGMYVRRLLDEGGFGPFERFDSCWGVLVEEAARCTVETYRSQSVNKRPTFTVREIPVDQIARKLT